MKFSGLTSPAPAASQTPAPVDFGPDSFTAVEVADLFGMSIAAVNYHYYVSKSLEKVSRRKTESVGAPANLYSAVSVFRTARKYGWKPQPTTSLFTDELRKKAEEDFAGSVASALATTKSTTEP